MSTSCGGNRSRVVRRAILVLWLMTLGSAAAPAGAAPFVVGRAEKIIERSAIDTEQFSVAASGDTVAVGHAGEDGGTDVTRVFVRATEGWSLQAELVPPGPALQYGRSVALDGDTLLVGADGLGDGSAYVYVRDSGIWSLQAELGPTDAGRGFGRDVEVDGDLAYVASIREGAIYVFRRIGEVWPLAHKIIVPETPVHSCGWSIAADMDTLIVGCPVLGRVGSGLAYVYRLIGGEWELETTLIEASSSSRPDGTSVDIEGDTAIVAGRTSSARIYRRTGGAWETDGFVFDPINNNTMPPLSSFGQRAALSGGRAIVSALHPAPGAAYVIERRAAGWTIEEKLDPVLDRKALRNAAGFGYAVAFSEDRVVVAGSADLNYVVFSYELTSPPETLSGQALTVRDPSGLEVHRRLTLSSKDLQLRVPRPESTGDPRCVGAGGGGASMQVSSPASGEVTVQPLPCENWSSIGAPEKRLGYRYLDKELDDGACKSVILRAGKGMKAKCLGRGDAVLDFGLAAGQSQAPIQVEVISGADWKYCLEFGGAIRRDDDTVFIAKTAPAPAACPVP